jgi:hypothetical protein
LLLEQTKMGTANVCLTEMSSNVFFCVGYGGYGSVCSRMQKPNLMIVTVREQLKFHFPFLCKRLQGAGLYVKKFPTVGYFSS